MLASASREKKMKDMLKQALEKHETKIVEVPVDRIVEKTIEVEKIAEVPTLIEKRVDMVSGMAASAKIDFLKECNESRTGTCAYRRKEQKRWTEGVLQAQFA